MTVALAAPDRPRRQAALPRRPGSPASTLHRLLEWRPADGAFGRNAERPLEADVAGRRRGVDAGRAAGRRSGGGAAAGDAAGAGGRRRSAPLGGPGHGAARRDRVAAPCPTVRLTEIFRQAAESLIVTNAHRIHDGELPELGAPPRGRPAGDDKRDFFFLEEDDPAKAALAGPRSGRHPLAAPLRLRPARHPGAGADAPGRAGRRQPEPAAAGGADRGRARRSQRGRARPPRRRQGDAGAQRLRQGGLQRRHRRHRARSTPTAETVLVALRRPRGHLRASTSSTSWRSPTPPPSTSRRAPSTRPSSCPSTRSTS